MSPPNRKSHTARPRVSASLRVMVSVLLAVAALQVGAARAASASTPAGPPVVRIHDGVLKGSTLDGVRRFAGIPYATPPVGALRWRPPAPEASWHGVRDATSFANECPQATGGSEDCLYLNVYAPPKSQARRLPVMVYIPGGGFVAGNAANYDATPLVRRGDVIVVTLNYRLGILGALALAALDANTHGLGSGAWGLLDQQAAMRWVQRNIRAFGGDPGNVTLFGESAGATYTCLNVVSPSAKGLLQAAIAESGCGLPTTPKSQAEALGTAIATQLGCVTSATVDLACLRAVTPAQANAAAAAVIGSPAGVALASIPAVGGGALPLSAQDAFSSGTYSRVPLILGTNENEGRLFVYTDAYGPIPTDEASYEAALAITAATTGKTISAIVAEYPLSAYTSPAEALSAVNGDSAFSCTTLNIDGLASEQDRVSAYQFTDPNAPSAVPGLHLGATHGSELTYLFDREPQTGELTPSQVVVSHQMINYWTTFARTHDPNNRGIPHWPHFDSASRLIQNLSPGYVQPRSAGAFAQDHHCGFWRSSTPAVHS